MGRSVLEVKWPTFSQLRPDLIIALIIFLFAAFWGARVVASGTIQSRFDQGLYTPAVMEACGKGFVIPAMQADKVVQLEKGGLVVQQSAGIPGLLDFLEQKQSSFDCQQIPPELNQGKLVRYQEIERYLMGAVALNWRLTGVSWDALTPLFALLFGLSCVAVYGVFRLGMDKPLAVGLAILFILSPLQANSLPHLRDYSKTPFIIATVLLLGWMVKYSLNARITVLVGIMAGTLLGFGIGFRMDLLVFVPAVLITLAVFTPSGYRRDAGTRLWAASAFIIAFLFIGWPILSKLIKGGGGFHVMLLGLMQPHDNNLGIRPSDVYEWGYLYHDWYVKSIVDSFSLRILGVNIIDPNARLIDMPKAYDRATMFYYLEILRNFPADIASRALAAILRVLQMSFDVAPLLVIVSMIIIAAHNLRLGLYAAIATMFLCGYPSVQFGIRHYFHLQFVSLFFVGVFFQVILKKGSVVFSAFQRNKTLKADEWLHGIFLRDYKRGVLCISAVLFAVAASIFFLRIVQQSHIRSMLQPYSQLSAASKKYTTQAISGDVNRFMPVDVEKWIETMKNQIDYDDYPLKTDYWILELDGRSCNKDFISFSIYYNFNKPTRNYSRTVVLDIKKPIRYFFHTYSSSESFFAGLDIDKSDLSCVKGFGRAIGFEKLPLLMNLTFSEGWENMRLYQSIGLF